MTEPSTELPVAGVWQRQFEEDPLGDVDGADRDTFVLWMQSKESGIYVDIRLPRSSPGLSLDAARRAGIEPRPGAITATGYSADAVRRLVQLGNDCVDTILRQKSFAGVLEYKAGDTTSSGAALREDTVLAKLASAPNKGNDGALALCTCFWRRLGDYQPPSGGLDVGVCASGPPNADGAVLLRETGDDASYAEGWLRIPKSSEGPFMALELVAENGRPNTRSGYFVRVANRFAYAIGRPKNEEAEAQLNCVPTSSKLRGCVGKSLAEAARSHADSDDTKTLNLVGSYLGLAGEIESTSQRWSILHSTNPELIGVSLVGDPAQDNLCCSRFVLPPNKKAGEVRLGDEIEQVLQTDDGKTGVRRRWKVVELTDCELPL